MTCLRLAGESDQLAAGRGQSICDLGESSSGRRPRRLRATDAIEPVDRFRVVVDERPDDGARVDDDVRRCARDRDPSG